MLTDNEKRVAFMFDDAMKLRDANELIAARHLLASLVEQLGPEDTTLLSHAHLQLSYIFGELGDQSSREAHSLAALAVRPKSELASLALFHALARQGRLTEALQEMVRLLRVRKKSEMYAELLGPRYEARLSPEQKALVGEARRLLARHRRD